MSQERTPPAAGSAAVGASTLMSELADTIDGERVYLGDVLDRLHGQGQGLLLLILSLPMCIPNVPGISTLFGALLIGPSLQLMRGRTTIWTPQFMRKWTMKASSLRGALRACVPLLRKVEHVAMPRLTSLTEWPATSLIGLQTLVMALVLILPIWGANLIPGIAVALTGLAILQRDGALVIASACVAVAALAWVYFGTYYTFAFFNQLWKWSIGWF